MGARSQLGHLLAAIGSTPTADPAPQATPYDWRDPHYFTADERNRLAQLLGQVAARMAEIFARFGCGVFEVSLQALTQHFAGDLGRRTGAPLPDQDRCLPFGSEKDPPCGFVSISPQTACTWARYLLGDAEASRETHRAISPLEESLLSDLLTAVLEAFLVPWRSAHPLRPAGPVAKGPPHLAFEPTEEVCRIVFQIKTAEADTTIADARDPGSEVAFLLPCRRLAALAGKPATTPAKVPPPELSRTLMEHLQEVPVTITAVLASTTMTFQEVLDLAPGDILLLDKPVEEPAELILDGRTAFRGRPARAAGYRAMVIVGNQRKDANGNA